MRKGERNCGLQEVLAISMHGDAATSEHSFSALCRLFVGSEHGCEADNQLNDVTIDMPGVYIFFGQT